MFYNLLPQFVVISIFYNPGVIFIYYILIFTSFYYSTILILSTLFSYWAILHRLMFYILLIYNWGGPSTSLCLSFALHRCKYDNPCYLYSEIQPVVWN